MRSSIERLTRNWTIKRKLPQSFNSAPIYVSPSAGLSYLCKSFEKIDQDLLRFCKNHIKPDKVVWDIGANIGLFSVAAANVVGAEGKVFAFEPDPWLVQLLRKTAIIQPKSAAGIDVIPLGVAGTCGLRQFGLANRSRATNFLEGYGQSNSGGAREWTTIYCIDLEWAYQNLPPADVIKIDVEGAEIELLEAGRAALTKWQPIVYVEVSRLHRKQATDLLHGMGYTLYDGSDQTSPPVPVAEATFNTIAIAK